MSLKPWKDAPMEIVDGDIGVEPLGQRPDHTVAECIGAERDRSDHQQYDEGHNGGQPNKSPNPDASHGHNAKLSTTRAKEPSRHQ